MIHKNSVTTFISNFKKLLLGFVVCLYTIETNALFSHTHEDKIHFWGNLLEINDAPLPYRIIGSENEMTKALLSAVTDHSYIETEA